MWTGKQCFFMAALLLSLVLLFTPSRGFCAATYQLTESELATLEENLNALARDNERLSTILTASTLDLNEAQAKSLSLQESLTEAKRTIEKLQEQLKTLRKESESAQESLKTANEELAKASASFKHYEREREKAERRLRNQRTAWQVIACVLAGVAIAT